MVPCDRAAQCEMNDGSYADRQGMISPSVQIPEVPVEHIRHMALSVAGPLPNGPGRGPHATSLASGSAPCSRLRLGAG